MMMLVMVRRVPRRAFVTAAVASSDVAVDDDADDAVDDSSGFRVSDCMFWQSPHQAQLCPKPGLKKRVYACWKTLKSCKKETLFRLAFK